MRTSPKDRRPETDMAHTAYSITSSAGREVLRNGEAERFGGRKIDDEIEFGRLLDRDIAGLRPAQNLVDKIGGATEQTG